ncbi:MAG TPA: tail fiber domain-containing protein, partial [Dissulfurispiraceae bacterium]|nr:tail fiber domain-containing protein [Dissulfurispiraceae bacterium]
DCDTPLIYGEFDTGLVNINGSLALTNVSYTSDIRLKKDIRPLTESLAKIMQLKGVSYDWKSDEYPGRGFAKGRQIGLIAQDVEATIPEVVTTARGGYKAISYNKLLPVLVEAFKEQQKTVEQQKSAINREGKLLDEREVVISEQKRQLDKNRLLIDKQQPEIEKRRQMLAELGMKVDALEANFQKLRSRDLTAGTIMDGRIGQ